MKPLTAFLLALVGASALAVPPTNGPVLDGARYSVPTTPRTTLIAPYIPPVRVEVTPAQTRPLFTDDTLISCNQVGYVLPAPQGILAGIPDSALLGGGGKVRRVELVSSGASMLRVQFTGLKRGIQLRVYVPGMDVVHGPFVSPRPSQDGTWWTPIVYGETIGLELYTPTAAPLPSLPEITAVGIGYADPSGFEPKARRALSCELDVTCYAAWADEARSVAQLQFFVGTGWASCTGSMVNRMAGDSSPLMLTANHCISTQTSADSLIATWGFQTPTCNGTPPNFNTLPQTQGAVLLRNNAGCDVTLLGLEAYPPSDTWWNGWNAGSQWADGSTAVSIHHPGGEFKRISFETKSGSGNISVTGLGTINTWWMAMSSGTAEPGSSGSPLYDSDHRVRGVDTAGQHRCPPDNEYYGRLDLAWGNVQPFLDTPASPCYVHTAAGGSETGAQTAPFNTLRPATYAVPSSGEIRVFAGNYPETFRIFRPMRITAEGGTAVIGR